MSEALRAAAPRDDAKAFLVQPMPPVPFGKYIVIGKLGHGGMAEVNLAVVGGKGGFRKLFVIKRLHSHLEHESGFIDMFLDEARLAAQLDHPNCVQTVEVGEDNGQHFLAMEYLDGQGLERILRVTGQRGDFLPLTVSVRMIADALDGLHYAHELRAYDGQVLGVVHRDVSPQNIFVTYNGVVKILDFGIAKAESNVVETRTGVVKGKYAYIAPEQALAQPVDRRADLWSMGVVLWEMLTSHRLFKSVNELATLNETLHGTIHPPSSYNPQVPPELDAILDRALQRDVSKRYATGAEFKDDLESWLATQTDPSDRKSIAALMKDRFGDLVVQHRQRLGECIASVANDPRSLDRLVTGGMSASVELDRAQSVSRSMEASWPVNQSSPGLSPSMTPTPSPRPHLGSGLTNSFPALSGIAPKSSREQPIGPPSGDAPFQEEITSSEWQVSGGSHSGQGVPAMSAPSPQITHAPQPIHGNSFTGTSSGSHSGMLMPPPERSSARRIGVILVGLASLLVVGVAGALTWARYGNALTAGVDAMQTEVGRIEGPAQVAPAAGGTVVAVPVPPTPPVAAQTELPTTPEVADPGTNPGTVPSRGQRPRRSATPPATPTAQPTPPPETPPPAPAAPETAARGFLSLVTSPWTTVTLDGRSLGDTPLMRVPLAPGTYSLRLRNADADIDESYEVTIEAGQTTTRRLGLR
jgi:serine/threonine protein kinase